jgi:hypothetical protein
MIGIVVLAEINAFLVIMMSHLDYNYIVIIIVMSVGCAASDIFIIRSKFH